MKVLEERMRHNAIEIQARASAFSEGSEETQQLVATLQAELLASKKQASEAETRANGLFAMYNELQRHADDLTQTLAGRHSRHLKLFVATFVKLFILFLVFVLAFFLIFILAVVLAGWVVFLAQAPVCCTAGAISR